MARTLLDPRVKSMSESALSAAIVDLATLTGWRVNYVPDWVWRLAFRHMSSSKAYLTRWSPPGAPDLTLLRDGRLVFAELKSHGGKVREPQQDWLDALRDVPGVEVYLWKPEQWIDGTIERILT